MKRLIAAGLGAVLASTVCWAQTAPGGSSNPPPAGGFAQDGGGRPEGQRRGPPDADGEREGSWHHRRPFMMGKKGGHLRFRRGETEINFKCAADDSTKACVDALMPLVDKLLQVR
ncbi:hypothetical protein [Methylobacterium durans]|uniref:hypothetical protein n=1 Tax=Methylobacterium durans TaxID=2202825 RepID=UPI0013A52EDF|nr:hypothetical protein [Methylobacterium durans]